MAQATQDPCKHVQQDRVPAEHSSCSSKVVWQDFSSGAQPCRFHMVGRHDAAVAAADAATAAEAPVVAEAARQRAMAASAAALAAAATERGAARVAEVTTVQRMRCCHKCGSVEFRGRTAFTIDLSMNPSTS